MARAREPWREVAEKADELFEKMRELLSEEAAHEYIGAERETRVKVRETEAKKERG